MNDSGDTHIFPLTFPQCPFPSLLITVFTDIQRKEPGRGTNALYNEQLRQNPTMADGVAHFNDVNETVRSHGAWSDKKKLPSSHAGIGAAMEEHPLEKGNFWEYQNRQSVKVFEQSSSELRKIWDAEKPRRELWEEEERKKKLREEEETEKGAKKEEKTAFVSEACVSWEEREKWAVAARRMNSMEEEKKGSDNEVDGPKETIEDILEEERRKLQIQQDRVDLVESILIMSDKKRGRFRSPLYIGGRPREGFEVFGDKKTIKIIKKMAKDALSIGGRFYIGVDATFKIVPAVGGAQYRQCWIFHVILQSKSEAETNSAVPFLWILQTSKSKECYIKVS